MEKPVPEDAPLGFALRLARLLSSNKPFIVVWLALFISVAGIGMVSPLLPVFAEDMGASGIWLGLAFSGFVFSQVPLMPVVGRLSDKFGKKPFLWLGLFVFTLTSAGYFWSPGYHELVLFRLLSGVGAAMVFPTAFAYVGELSPHGHEGRYMGLFNMAVIAGLGVGPVLGGIVYDSLGMDATFVSMGILSAVGLLVVLLFLPGRTSSARATKFEETAPPLASMLRDDTIRGIVSFQLAYGLGSGAVLAFLGIFMTTVLDTSVAQVGIVLFARAILSGTLAYPFGWLADRGNRGLLATIGLMVVASGILAIPWVGSFALLLALFIGIGAFESMAQPAVIAMNVEKGRDMGMGSVMGIYNMAMSLGMVTGSLVGGVIESSLGIGWVFRCVAGLAFAGIVIFNVFMRRVARRPKEPVATSWPGAPPLASGELATPLLSPDHDPNDGD